MFVIIPSLMSFSMFCDRKKSVIIQKLLITLFDRPLNFSHLLPNLSDMALSLSDLKLLNFDHVQLQTP